MQSRFGYVIATTRIAPTPSGFLHLGNLVNFRLVDMVATELELSLTLRIDDADAGRLREQYLEDIFRVLKFLNITCNEQSPSQLTRTAHYWNALNELADAGAPLFVCTCSRTQMPRRRCEAGCARTLANFDTSSGEDRVRLRYETEDVTLWGREHPSYHLVNVVDDRDLRITHVVRGADLEPSTRIHEFLNSFLEWKVKYAHHELLLDEHGHKISKSQGTNQLVLGDELLAEVHTQADRLISRVLSQLG